MVWVFSARQYLGFYSIPAVGGLIELCIRAQQDHSTFLVRLLSFLSLAPICYPSHSRTGTGGYTTSMLFSQQSTPIGHGGHGEWYCLNAWSTALSP
mmetsp:Transcript_18809/g.29385  ORF Transcript_18809/g.29385 Transcript_18809/m.29385 type:complete len:96 (-) Transcript_18809:123-410(-)